MNDKLSNPFLKQMISEIASKTKQGRIIDLNWQVLSEAKKKKKKVLKTEADNNEEEENLKDTIPLKGSKQINQKPAKTPAPAPEEAPADDKPTGEAPPAPEPTEAPAPDASPETAPEEADQAQADASKAKAELEKAKAEKSHAEKEIKEESHIKLDSHAGTQFLLGKIVDHAFKTNTIDSLAAEMVQKLKIQTVEDMNAFIEETASFRVIPGFPDLLASMKTLATKQPDKPEEDAPEAGKDSDGGLDESAANTELSNVTINGKPVDLKSLGVDGVDGRDHPDYSDAFFSSGEYTDGTELSDEDLIELGETHGDLLNSMAHERGPFGA